MLIGDIKKLTKENTNFRKVLYTGKNSQIVAMNIAAGQDIGEEVHPEVDQIIFLVDGEAEASFNGDARLIEEHDTVFITAGTVHNIKNIGDEDLKLFTVYSPPHHPDGTIHKTKMDANLAENEGDG